MVLGDSSYFHNIDYVFFYHKMVGSILKCNFLVTTVVYGW